MKGYKIFIGIGLLLLLIYIIAEINRPQPLDWSFTLGKSDKNPYGSFIVYQQLKDLFPEASIESYREPLYNRLHRQNAENTAYILLEPSFAPGETDVSEACDFVANGNYMFISAFSISKNLMDTLGLKLNESYSLLKDSIPINFVNPHLHARSDYYFSQYSGSGFFSKISKPDSTVILGNNKQDQPNFVKINYGYGAFFVHAMPVCFTNHFMLTNNLSEYTSKALSYIPSSVSRVMWDEYYKSGRTGATTPMRFFLSNEWLSWALWLSISGLILFVLFEMKRKQRVIPVMLPLRNTTLDFVKTVASLYYNQRDNDGIAQKKIQYWLEFVRQHFYLSTQQLDQDFVMQLSKKSGVETTHIQQIVDHAVTIQASVKVSDALLMEINRLIDSFYQIAK